MPDTLTLLDALNERCLAAGIYGLVPDILAIKQAHLAHIDALTAAVEALPLYDENTRTMADAAESMRNRAVAILRGERAVLPEIDEPPVPSGGPD
jgi:hypothetical protein